MGNSSHMKELLTILAENFIEFFLPYQIPFPLVLFLHPKISCILLEGAKKIVFQLFFFPTEPQELENGIELLMNLLLINMEFLHIEIAFFLSTPSIRWKIVNNSMKISQLWAAPSANFHTNI